MKLEISFVIGGITIKIMPEKLTGKSHVCRKTHINIFGVWQVKRFSKRGAHILK